ncbi:MAG: hypothetical protein ACYDCF_11220 [Burkholderiales bacterium]
MRVLPEFYNKDASPQNLYRIKKEIVRIMRDEHHLEIGSDDFRRVRVEILDDGQSVNLVVPPNLLTKTLH